MKTHVMETQIEKSTCFQFNPGTKVICRNMITHILKLVMVSENTCPFIKITQIYTCLNFRGI